MPSSSLAVVRRILLVEDDDVVRRSLHLLLSGEGFEVKSYAGAQMMAGDPGAADADVLIADYRLADGNGLGVLRNLRLHGWLGHAVLITGHYSDALADAAIAAGYQVVLEKPLRHGQLLATLAPA